MAALWLSRKIVTDKENLDLKIAIIAIFIAKIIFLTPEFILLVSLLYKLLGLPSYL